jgi:hypothetical protein
MRHLQLAACGLSVAVLAGCASIPTSGPVIVPQSPAPAAADQPSASLEGPFTLRVEITDGSVEPRPSRQDVAAGTPVVVVVSSDTDRIVAVPGVLDAQVASPGKPAVLRFTPERSGVYEVVAKSPDVLLTQVQVQ